MDGERERERVCVCVCQGNPFCQHDLMNTNVCRCKHVSMKMYEFRCSVYVCICIWK